MIRDTAITIVAIAALLGAAGCEQHILVDVNAGAPDTAVFDGMHRFAISHQSATQDRQAALVAIADQAAIDFAHRNDFTPDDRQPTRTLGYEQPDLINELSAVASRAFSYRGWQNNAQDPQFVVSVDCVTGPFDFFVPRHVETNPEAQGTAVVRGNTIGGRPLPNPSADQAFGEGRAGRSFVHAIAIYVYHDDQPTGRPIWSGTATTVNTIEPFHRVAPLLIDELVREFPYGTGQAAGRSVSIGQQ